ncbi:tetratricopeptide repeat protein [Corallococcus sp. AS-1-12]|uniref:tetratricopeptide repeat protein n=1 Tax=Corallococcus sp. AS-1-12 TaxID=2874598 RepID=UPI001CBDDDC0|nr:tetratricopeptide repeat protein [Corallococcus sp. AS-1-12]
MRRLLAWRVVGMCVALGLALWGVVFLVRDGFWRSLIPVEESVLPGPYRNSHSTHVLIADFEGSTAGKDPFSRKIALQLTRALKQYQEEEFRDPKRFDIKVPDEALEVVRLNRTIESHEEAEEISARLGANVVIWGEVVGDADGGAKVFPRATLTDRAVSIRASEPGIEMARLGRFDLPTLQVSKSFYLVQFALGLHFIEQENPWLAVRFLQKSAEQVLDGQRNAESLDFMLATAYLALPNLDKAMEYAQQALDRVAASGSVDESILLNVVGIIHQEGGRLVPAIDSFTRAFDIERTNGRSLGAVADFSAARLLSALNRAGNYEEESKLRSELNGAVALKARKPSPMLTGWQGLVLRQLSRIVDTHGESRWEAAGIGGLGSQSSVARAGELRGFCRVMHEAREYAKGLEFCRLSLEMYRDVMGPKHPRVALALAGMAINLQDMRKFSEARRYLLEAMGMLTEVRGLDHPDTAYVFAEYGGLLIAEGFKLSDLKKLEEARTYLEPAMVKLEAAYGRSHEKLFPALSQFCFLAVSGASSAGDLDLCRRAYLVEVEFHGADSPRTKEIGNAYYNAVMFGRIRDLISKWVVVVDSCPPLACGDLRVGDVVVEYEGVRIRNAEHLRRVFKGGAKHRLKVIRSGAVVDVVYAMSGLRFGIR